MRILGSLFGPRRHASPVPTADDIAAIDLEAMIAVARERGDVRSDEEVVAALILGAEFMSQRHPDETMRLRAAAASTAATRWLTGRVGHDEAARLLGASEGPIDAEGVTSRPPG